MGSGSGKDGSDGFGGYGGGVYLGTGEHSIARCLLRDNEARTAGGVYNYNQAVTTISDSTISGNIADGEGGGIWNMDPGIMSLDHVTVTLNTANNDDDTDGDGGGIYAPNNLTMTNTIVANNSVKGGQCPDCYGEPVSQDYNLLGICEGIYCTFAAQANDLVGTTASPVDPLLSALRDNGGPTLTHLVDIASPAAGKIPEGVNGCDSISVDQRGVIRLAPCDIGAYETGKVWGGDESDDWHTDDNWLPSGVPSIDQPVTIYAGDNDATCLVDDAEAAVVSIAGGALIVNDYYLTIGNTP